MGVAEEEVWIAGAAGSDPEVDSSHRRAQGTRGGILVLMWAVIHSSVSAFTLKFYRHSLVDCGSSQLYLSVCVSVCLSVCLSVPLLRLISRLL